jgi:photosystem II stability/assembly factor-like uncharacterized protein
MFLGTISSQGRSSEEYWRYEDISSNVGLGTYSVTDVSIEGDNVLIASSAGKIVQSTNRGDTFSDISNKFSGIGTSNMYSAEVKGTYQLISGNGAKIYMSTNTGSTFSDIKGRLSGVSANIQRISKNGTTIIVGVNAGVAYLSTNNGVNFTDISNRFAGTTSSNHFFGVCAYDNYILMGAWSGKVYLSTNTGTTFVDISDRFSGLGSNDIYSTSIYGSYMTVCGVSSFYISDDYGTTFTDGTGRLPGHHIDDLIKDAVVYENYIVAISRQTIANQKIYISKDYGTTFTDVAGYFNITDFLMCVDMEGDKVIVGTIGGKAYSITLGLPMPSWIEKTQIFYSTTNWSIPENGGILSIECLGPGCPGQSKTGPISGSDYAGAGGNAGSYCITDTGLENIKFGTLNITIDNPVGNYESNNASSRVSHNSTQYCLAPGGLNFTTPIGDTIIPGATGGNGTPNVNPAYSGGSNPYIIPGTGGEGASGNSNGGAASGFGAGGGGARSTVYAQTRNGGAGTKGLVRITYLGLP